MTELIQVDKVKKPEKQVSKSLFSVIQMKALVILHYTTPHHNHTTLQPCNLHLHAQPVRLIARPCQLIRGTKLEYK